MKILALEFSSPQRSVAVAAAPGDGARQGRVSERRIHAGPADGLPVFGPASGVSVSEVIETARGHAMRPLGLAEEAMRQAGLEREQIDGIAIGLGPGSYTGIRAAIALAQGWQLARGVKLLGLSSAACIAAQAQAEGIRGRTAIVIDAQRDEFYRAEYDLGPDGCREVAPLRLAPMKELRELESAGAALVGPEVPRWFPLGRAVFPRAATLARLASGRTDFVAGEELRPIYLRETKFLKAPPPRALPTWETHS